MPTSKHVTVQWADVQRQIGGNDCGLFAIAVATCLCFGILPHDCEFDQGLMRSHLAMCFKKGQPKLFPQLSQARQHRLNHRIEKYEVFCHCRQPYIAGIFMAQCDVCQDWFHRGCQRIPRNINKETLFICKKCK